MFSSIIGIVLDIFFDYTLYFEINEMTTDQRPWGSYSVLVDEKTHKIKKIIVHPNARLSLQKHKYRQEHWYVLEGKGLVTLDKNSVELKQGECIDIPRESIHRVANLGLQNLVFIEIQTGSYFGEDDIERFEDDYGRCN